MKKIFSILAAVLFVGSMFAADVYSLEQVTSVEAGKSYVIVRNDRALVASVASSKLQTTNAYVSENLEGTENYVWTMESATGGVYMKADGKYLNNKSGATDMMLQNAPSSVWEFDFANDVAKIKNYNKDKYRYIGESNTADEYKCYASESDGANFTVYVLKKEETTKPAIIAKKIDFGTVMIESEAENYTLDTVLAVSARNLEADITVTASAHVTATEATLPAEGGDLHLHIVAAPGEFAEKITLASGETSVEVEIVGVVKQKAAPGAPGVYTLFTDELEEGDYLVVANTYAMKAEIASDRLANVIVSVDNDQIDNDDESIIWHIAKSGDYWTFYNAAAAVYAASTGAKNKAALAEEISDNTLWTATVVKEGVYDFINKKNDAAGVNAILRSNGQYGFACYSTSTGSSVSLYKGTPKAPTAISNTAVETKAIKTISNGMLIIEKNGVRYNVMGQAIR